LIRYTPQAQLTLEGFHTPFCQYLDKDNRWIKLADCNPWDKLANVYYRKMDSGFGAPSLSARMVIGAVIIKQMLNIVTVKRWRKYRKICTSNILLA
jgi:hypothetical protein